MLFTASEGGGRRRVIDVVFEIRFYVCLINNDYIWIIVGQDSFFASKCFIIGLIKVLAIPVIYFKFFRVFSKRNWRRFRLRVHG